ncbi:hypothetical protein [Streptomyces clavuligerus]|uniref:Uncharacterized protein n=1 Tax=Streptomyces clavuligerus TaxID=1901 RepID=D5SIL1_STRCL|nr:hypothetical protein [Streptomyces clavuligerus]EFG03754.1 Hypothetical protein SCLAV_p0263 [Streptomyces clavuligerus]MBY6307709.1 hypothetical protein [Streptomyces clavuligerus]QCS09741.1 hypothetical protein CRV15_29420 [Streptomyces clavuligerus]QPJ98214.1 hypothetical protein GE265_34980 [Streptomyces clavuligerus]WDN56451.1 hypothetical protein LL058_31935 [Streptomyces clavuligerus]
MMLKSLLPVSNKQVRPVAGPPAGVQRQEFARLIVTTGTERGETVGCTTRLVAAWEDGDIGLPRAVYRRILTRLTRRAPDTLGFWTGHPAPAATAAPCGAVPCGTEDSVDLRGFLADGAGAALGLLPLRAAGPGRIGSVLLDSV